MIYCEQQGVWRIASPEENDLLAGRSGLDQEDHQANGQTDKPRHGNPTNGGDQDAADQEHPGQSAEHTRYVAEQSARSGPVTDQARENCHGLNMLDNTPSGDS